MLMRKFNEIVKGFLLFVQALLLLSNKKCENFDNKNSQKLTKDKKVTTKAIDVPGDEQQNENHQSQKPVRKKQPENLEKQKPAKEDLQRQNSNIEKKFDNHQKKEGAEEKQKLSKDDKMDAQKPENIEKGTKKYGDHLKLFIETQEKGNSGDNYEEVKKQLVAGNKTGHWIWYIFPQLPFGTTSTSLQFSISCLDEAKEYLANPVLSKRIEECTRLVLAHAGKKSANEIFSQTKDTKLGLDTMKFRSSMTLFALASADPKDNIFKEAVDKFFEGKMDENTVKKVKGQ